MDYRKHNEIDPWDNGVYGTGRTEPPKSNSGIVALLMIVIIFLSGIISVLSFMNIRLFHQLQQAQIQTDTVPMAFSAMESDSALENNILEESYDEASAVRISVLGMAGEYVSLFDQHYFNWPAGMLVTLMDEGSRAEALGLEIGDILTEINGSPITSQTELDAFFAAGDKGLFTVTVHRDGTLITLNETN